MSKPTQLTAIFAALFPKSESALYEKMTVEELNILGQEATDIDAKLKDTSAVDLAADLATANAKITELSDQLTAASAKEATLNTQVADLTKERNTYKEQHDKAAAAGIGKPKEDANSRETPKVASYNAHAQEVFNKLNAGK